MYNMQGVHIGQFERLFPSSTTGGHSRFFHRNKVSQLNRLAAQWARMELGHQEVGDPGDCA